MPLVEITSRDYQKNVESKYQLTDLELFLAKSKQRKQNGENYEDVMFELFHQAAGNKPYPVAPACYLAEKGISSSHNMENWCLRADPVQLTPDRDELILTGPEVLSLSMPEAEHLITELNELFEEDGWRLEAKTATRWYLHLPEDPQILTNNLSQVRGQPIGQYLPSGEKGKTWHRIMNEVQMVLHSSKVNSERQKHDQPPVSSLWFWGGGKLAEYSHSNWSQVWSDEVLSLGLAKLTRTPSMPEPENSKSWLRQVNSPGEHLIIYEGIILQPEKESGDKYRKLQEFENQWIIPLLEALRNDEIERLTINACDGRSFSLTKNRLKYWWYRRKSIQTYCR